MKVILITYNTPSSENIRGTSALPYHIIKGRSTALYENETLELRNAGATKNDDVEIEIYTYNNNGLSDEKIAEVEKELGVTIKKVPLPGWYRWMFKLHLLFLRVVLKFPIANYIKLPKRYVDEINEQKPDLIWVMGEELSRIVKQFPRYKRIQIGPDTESLYYYRMLGRRFVMNSPVDYWKCALMYRKYARMERNFCTDDNFTYCAVGEEDVRHLKQLNPKVKARFLRHPHYEVSPQLKMENGSLTPSPSPKGEGRIKHFHQPKIKVLIAGQYNHYMKQEADLLVEQICNGNVNGNVNCLKDNYFFTFLGKGWERHVDTLRSVGYEVNYITFAPDYIEEIVKHDIQLTPIAIGTGTKGKVLDALANGLLVIGTQYALENIVVKSGETCVEYRHPQEVIEVLLDIPNSIRKYEAMAEEGRRQVLEHHNRTNIASELFGFNNNNSYR